MTARLGANSASATIAQATDPASQAAARRPVPRPASTATAVRAHAAITARVARSGRSVNSPETGQAIDRAPTMPTRASAPDAAVPPLPPR